MSNTPNHQGSAMDDSHDAATPPARKGFGIKKSYLLAAVFALALGLWLASGDVIIGGKTTAEIPPIAVQNEAAAGSGPAKLFRVRAQEFVATPRSATLLVRGRTEADIQVDVKAETAGQVVELGPSKGAEVKTGEVLCRLDTAARQSMLAQAEAAVKQAEADFDATSELARRGNAPGLRVAADRARLDAARAALAEAKLDLARTRITAPFDGVVEMQYAKIGNYLAVGGECARLVSLDPLLAVGQVPERAIGALKAGLAADVRLITGERAKGTVRFVAAAADVQTRTFRLEVAIDNPNNTLRDGLTAEITVPLAAADAHLIPPAILTLSDAGQVGVRTVLDGRKVQFVPVTLLAEEKTGIWVAGLPGRATIITVGQDFVVDGQEVEVVMDARDAATTSALPDKGAGPLAQTRP